MRIRLSFFLAGLASVLAALPLQSAEPLRAGADATDVSPREWPLPLRGSFSPRAAESLHDPLYVRTLVLDDGETRLSITVVDSISVPRRVLDQAKAIAAEKSGIPASHMLMAATHTHTAPPSYSPSGTPPEVAYGEVLLNGIVESVVKAAENLQPAEIAWSGEGLPDEVFNRRWFMKPGAIPADPFGKTTDTVMMMPPRESADLQKPAGPTDPEVSILSVRTAEGRPLCLLANYSLHFVGGVPTGQVSADYFGQFASLIENRLSRLRPVDGFVGILSNGTSGDVNNVNFRKLRPPREPFEQIRIVAGKTADTAYRAYEKVAGKHEKVIRLGMVEREITLDVRMPTSEQVERARKIIAMNDKEKESLPGLAEAYAVRTLNQAKAADTVDVKIQAIRIGDLAIVTLPFEVFAEIGLDLKEKSPFGDTFVVQLANGAQGYLPTPRQHEFGGYETWFTTNRVQFDASDVISRNLLEMLAILKRQ